MTPDVVTPDVVTPHVVTPDVVIVGAGAAGLFCALQLADHASVTVVEAGVDPGDPPPEWLLEDALFPPSLDWGYRDAATGRELRRGRVTGGSTSVNSSAALRGQPGCFDGWDVPGWDWTSCLPGFLAVECDEQFGEAPYHGASGPIPITRLPPGPIDRAFDDACGRAAHAQILDHNAPGALGVGPWPTNRRDGGRWGTHAGVLPRLRGRVELRSETTVRRVLIERGRCRGLELSGPGGEVEVLAAPLVVLCGGAYGTPELLLRSGIGPEKGRATGVELVQRLEGVGENLQDHPWCLLDVLATDPSAPAVRPVSGTLLRYESSDGRDELQIFPFQSQPYEPAAPSAQVSVAAALMTPRSRGRLVLGPNGATEIRLRHLDDPGDATAMAAAVRHSAALIDDLVAGGVVTVGARPWWRGEDLEAACRRSALTYNHPVGTCRMGPPADPTTVVGADLRVLGIEGLVVADASVMPVIPRANTNLASMMIGWRAGNILASRPD